MQRFEVELEAGSQFVRWFAGHLRCGEQVVDVVAELEHHRGACHRQVAEHGGDGLGVIEVIGADRDALEVRPFRRRRLVGADDDVATQRRWTVRGSHNVGRADGDDRCAAGRAVGAAAGRRGCHPEGGIVGGGEPGQRGLVVPLPALPHSARVGVATAAVDTRDRHDPSLADGCDTPSR